VGEIPLDVQVSLLRVMQEREFERLGGTDTVKADVRMIAATNRDLGAAIASGAFRSDLFYRLNVFPIEVPPLRERREDIPLLVESFLAHYSSRMGRVVRKIHSETMEVLIGYDWPGNIRELQNVVERGVIVADDGVLRVEPKAFLPKTHAQLESDGNVLRQKERETIEHTLGQSRGRVAGKNGAAARLQLPPSTLESRIRALGIDKHRFRMRMAALTKSSGE
jgi:transcriptional regulator with GAF, ATPase, and Fis domain